MGWLDKYIPKAQNGVKATKQDSLALRDNTRNLLKFYKDYESTEFTPLSKSYKDVIFEDLDVINENFNIEGNNFMSAKIGDNRDIPNTEINYRKTIDSNKFKQREKAKGVLNIDAPMALYDRRITPTGMLNTYKDGDVVNIPYYDELAVTPWDMLTSEQQKERIEKFGTDGTPFSKPTSYIQPRYIGQPLDLNSQGLNVSEQTPTSSLEKIPQKAIKNWDVEQSVNQNFGSNTKKFKATSRKELEALKRKQAIDEQTKTGNKNTLKITPNYYQDGGVIEDDRGQWAHPGQITKINSNDITMKGVNYPVLGISNTGDQKLMMPGQDYKFQGKNVTEYPIAQNGKTLGPKEFTESYIQSPKYKERLKSSGYENVDDEINTRLERVKNVNIYNPGDRVARYSGLSNNIDINPKIALKVDAPYQDVLAHELSHAETFSVDKDKDRKYVYPGVDYESMTRLNDYDHTQLKDRLLASKQDNMDLLYDGDHSWQSDENKADLNAIRYAMFKEGIYDPRTEDATQEHINKLREINDERFIKLNNEDSDEHWKDRKIKYSPSGERPMYNYEDKDLLWLMNNIAQNKSKPNNNSTNFARNGAWLEKYNK